MLALEARIRAVNLSGERIGSAESVPIKSQWMGRYRSNSRPLGGGEERVTG